MEPRRAMAFRSQPSKAIQPYLHRSPGGTLAPGAIAQLGGRIGSESGVLRWGLADLARLSSYVRGRPGVGHQPSAPNAPTGRAGPGRGGSWVPLGGLRPPDGAGGRVPMKTRG